MYKNRSDNLQKETETERHRKKTTSIYNQKVAFISENYYL